MTDLTGKLIANTYKDILTVDTSTTNSGLDNNLRKVQDGAGNSSSLKLSQTAAAFTGNVSVNGNLNVEGTFRPDYISTSALEVKTISATNITTDTLTAGNLTFQNVSVSSLRTGDLYAATISAGTISATNINATNITVDGDGVATSSALASVNAALVSVEAVISSNIVFVLEAQASVLTVLAGLSATDTQLQNNINLVSTTVSAVNVQVGINANQINTLSTSIAANASAIAVNSAAITSINSFISAGAFASAGTSATLETRIAAVSSTMATSINNSNTAITNLSATLESRIASTSSTLESHINTVSATLSSTNVALQTSIANSNSAITALSATMATSISNSNSAITALSATMATSIDNSNVAIAANTSLITALSSTLESRIATVSSTMASSIASVSSTLNTRIASVSSTMATSIANSNSAIAALSATMATSIANHLPLTGGTLTGALTLNADPAADLQAATKQYVDNLTASGIHFHQSVRVENPGALTVTYNNGTAGVGATLTNAGTQAALVIDGITMVVDDRVLIYEQTDATQNGVYVVTDIGSGSTNWVLTRSSDTDTSGNQDDSSLDEGSYFFVEEGDTGAGESYVCSTVGTITFGTTEINFVQFSSAITYTAGTGININASRVISTSGVATAAQLAALSATMATSIDNSNSAITSVNTRINSVSVLAETKASASTSANLETRINSVSVLAETKASAATSANLETRINTVSSTMATSIGNSNTAIATLSATLATSISNYLPLAGGTVTGDISFGDNDKAIFGAGTDLQIYHDGSNSAIQNSTGELFVYGGGDQIRIRAENGEESIVANPNGSVDLYHDNSAKLTTTSTGIEVTGNVVSEVAINTQTGTTYTTVLADQSKLVTLNNASAITLTLPANSAVAYPVGTKIDIAELGVGQVTVVGAGGVTVNGTPTLKLRAQYSAATCIKIATDTWLLVGDLAES